MAGPVARWAALPLALLMLVTPAAIASDDGLSCRFSMIAHDVEPSVVDPRGEWLSRTLPGYHYIQIEPETIRPLTGLPGPADREGFWFHERTEIELRGETRYAAQRVYYAFAPGGGLDRIVLVHIHEDGDQRAALFEASPRGMTTLSLPGASGLVQTGFGRCALTSEVSRVFSGTEPRR